MAKRKGYTPKKTVETEQIVDVKQEVKIDPIKKKNYLPYILVFAFGFLLYANTISFEYALDDKLYITANEFTTKGFDGIKEIWMNDLMVGFFGSKKNLVEGGRYRPLALTTHAIEWQFFKKTPGLSHFINVVLYGLIGVFLLSVLRRIFGWKDKKWWWGLSFLTVLIYLAHPLHTEVTANIKSRDEIMSLLFALLAFRSVLIYLESKSNKELLLSGAWFILSLFSKESSVTFLGVIPLTLIFFPKGNLKESLTAMAPLAVFTLVYLGIRLMVFADQGASLDVAAELMNKPYLQASDSERMASIFLTMGIYLKLLVFPHPLTHDYYPFHPFRTFAELEAGARPYVDWSDPWAAISLLLYAAILGYGLFALYQRIKGKKANIIGYGLLIYFGTFILFSNLFFDIGAFMNERFLFIPSLGYALILSYLFTGIIEKKLGSKVSLFLLVALLFGFSGKTIARNFAWENDRTLAESDVLTSDGSAKVKMTMGSELLEKAKETANPNEKTKILKQGEQYCLQSLKIYPAYFPPLDIIGNIYFEMGNYPNSIYYFTQAALKKSNDSRIVTNLEVVANTAAQKGDPQSAIKGYETLVSIKRGKERSRIYSSLGEVYGKNLNDLPSSKKYLAKAIAVDPENAAAYQKIGIVYAMLSQADSALYSFNRSLEIEPENARVMLNLGILYNQMGNTQMGNQYLAKAQQLDPSINSSTQ